MCDPGTILSVRQEKIKDKDRFKQNMTNVRAEPQRTQRRRGVALEGNRSNGLLNTADAEEEYSQNTFNGKMRYEKRSRVCHLRGRSGRASAPLSRQDISAYP